MSVAVAVSKGGWIALATDSQTNFGEERVPPENLVDVKYHRIGDAYLAASGWTLYSNILDDLLAAKRSVPRLDDERRIFTFFNGLWRVLHERYSFVKDQATDNEGPFGSLDSTFLLAAPSGIFSISTDLSVTRLERYFAIGSGALIAMGAMRVLYEREDRPQAIAEQAVQAAIDHNIYCGPPINLVTLRRRAVARRARKRSSRR